MTIEENAELIRLQLALERLQAIEEPTKAQLDRIQEYAERIRQLETT